MWVFPWYEETIFCIELPSPPFYTKNPSSLSSSLSYIPNPNYTSRSEYIKWKYYKKKKITYFAHRNTGKVCQLHDITFLQYIVACQAHPALVKYHLVHDFKRKKRPISIALPGTGALQIKITFSIHIELQDALCPSGAFKTSNSFRLKSWSISKIHPVWPVFLNFKWFVIR